MTDQPVHVWFAQLVEHPAFRKLVERAENIIEDEKKLFWKMDKDKALEQHAKVQGIEEFWGKLMVYIKNSQNHPNK